VPDDADAPSKDGPERPEITGRREKIDAQTVFLLEEQMAAHEAQLRAYEVVPLPPSDHLDEDRALALARLTLELGLRSERMHLDWLRDAVEWVRGLPPEGG